MPLTPSWAMFLLPYNTLCGSCRLRSSTELVEGAVLRVCPAAYERQLKIARIRKQAISGESEQK